MEKDLNEKIIELDSYYLDEILKLWEISSLQYKPKGRDSRDYLLNQFKLSNVKFLGIKKGSELIAVCLLTDDGRKGWINRLAVHPKYRRKDLAKKLIAKAEEYFNNKKIHIYCALIETYNTPSLNLFQKTGYKLHNDIVYLTKREFEEI